MQPFYHSSIRNYTIGLLDLFNDLYIPRYSSTGDRLEDIRVPIQFGNKDKAYYINKIDNENLINGNVNVFPRMALEFNSMDKDLQRNTNKLNKINRVQKDGYKEYQYNGVAYNFNYTLHIATRTFTDTTILVEQIAPMFNPSITIKIQELDWLDEPTSILVQIGDFNIELPDEMEEDEIRIITTEVPITIKGNLYLPIREASIIKEIDIKTRITDDYGLDELVSTIKTTETGTTKIDEDITL